MTNNKTNININDLIKQYCSNGVEYKELWQLTYWDKRFKNVEKEKQQKIIKFIHISAEQLKSIKLIENGNIRLLSTGNYIGYTTEDYIENKQSINNGEVISIPSGGGKYKIL